MKRPCCIPARPNPPAILTHAAGRNSAGRRLLVSNDGTVVEIGSDEVEVMGISLFMGGQKLLESTAIESWEEVSKAAHPVLDLIKRDGTEYLMKVILGNQIISMTITGFETYCKRRFVEMIGEGRSADYEKLAIKIFSKAEREAKHPELLRTEAISLSMSPVELVVERRRINFQAYDKSKTAFAAAYGIQFGELGLPNSDLKLMQEVFSYRHRIIHVSPIIGMLNQPKAPPEQPVFAGYEIAARALAVFNTFIHSIHNRSLRVPA